MRSCAPSRSTGFRFAPTGARTLAGRPAGRSVSRTRRAENAQFWAGNRQGDGATPKSPMSARRGPTCRWSPSPTTRSTTGRFLRSSGPTNGRLTFSCMRASQRGFRPSRATGTKSTMLFCATTSTASTKLSGRYLRDKATTEPELNVLGAGFFRKHRHRMRYHEPQGQWPWLRRRPPTKSWSTNA